MGFCIALLFLIFTLPLESHAQVLYGSLTGNVTDPSGAAVPGAKVEAINIGTGTAKSAITDNRGVFLISVLQPGVYRVAISAQGFATAERENVRVNANTEPRVNVQLQLGQASQRITVTSGASILQTDRSDVKSELSQAQVASLPLGTDRNFQTLYRLIPGSSPPVAAHSFAANPTGALGMNVNGGSDTSNWTLIDGTADPNYWELNIIAYVPPAEAIQSVNIVTGGFDAEQGQAGGSVSNVTIKSGTNSFHGAAWEYNTTSALQARNFFFYGAKNPKDILNQFGLDLGGPIKKDKLFFFVDWERYRLSQAVSTLNSVPTEAIRNGDFSGVATTIYNPATGNADGTGRTAFAGNRLPVSMLSPAAQKMTALIPAPNFGNGIANNYFSAGDLRFDRDSVDLKINYNPSDRSTIFGRYSAEPTFVFDPQVLGPAGGPALGQTSQPGNAYGLTQNAALAGTYTFTPHVLLDANIGFTRQRLSAENTDITQNYGLNVLGIPGTNGPDPLQGGYPGFFISGFTSLGNSSISNPFLFRDPEYIYSANLSWVKGAHSIRFGTSVGRFDLNHTQGGIDYGKRGGFTFTGGLTALKGGSAPTPYNAWADFLLGLPQAMGKDYNYINPATVRESTYAFYARDQWQATRRLSVNYGLRYEYYPFATQDHYGGINYDPNTNLSYLGGIGGVPRNAYVDAGRGQLNPRLGVAYRLNESTVIRAGAGLSSDPYPFECMVKTYPIILSQQIAGLNSYFAAGSLSTGLPAFSGPDLSLGKFVLPTYLGTNAFPEKFHRGYTEAYNFTLERAVGKGFNAQAAYVGTRTIRAIVSQNINAAGPGGGSHGTPLYELWGNPNSINEFTPFNTATYNSLQTQLTRRVGSAQMGVIYTYSKALDDVDDATGGLTWNWAPMLNRNYAPAGYDRTHNFQFYGIYPSPFGHGQRWVNHGLGAAILGGWTFSPILSRMSGLPFTVTSSGASVNAPGNQQTADQVLPTVDILGGHGPGAPYFEPGAFAPVKTVRFGTTGRNLLRGPGFFDLDASLARDFKIKERFTLQFRAEAYGLTNTPQFANPSANVSSASFVNGTISSLNGFGIISSATGQRQIRFGLKLSF